MAASTFLRRLSSRMCSCSKNVQNRCQSSRAAITEDLGDRVARSFQKEPHRTVQQILEGLQPGEKAQLVSALNAEAKRHTQSIQSATRSATASGSGVPKPSVLLTVALAAGLPFIFFGFSDNAIMIVAGDEIENVFGARLGLSTLAAAGLGNLVSDVVGLGMAEPIQARVGGWLKVGPLTPQQRQLWQTRVARLSGSSLGVSIGCLLGMIPLFFMKPKHVEDSRK